VALLYRVKTQGCVKLI